VADTFARAIREVAFAKTERRVKNDHKRNNRTRNGMGNLQRMIWNALDEY